jgi:transposase
MENPARLFHCARCRAQVLICSRCDRGNLYCGRICAQQARRESLRAAGARYQRSRRGRLCHAERQRRYRRRPHKVTHQGSAAVPPHDSLAPESRTVRGHHGARPPIGPRCHVCHRPCSAFVRLDFLHSPGPRRFAPPSGASPPSVGCGWGGRPPSQRNRHWPSPQSSKILRYFHVEQWRVGTIARQLGIHHGTVDRVLSQAGLPKTARAHRPSLIDAFLPFVAETLRQFPGLTASRLYAMVRERGYHGGEDHFRHLIAHHRPAAPAEAYLRLRTLPEEQGQVDWAHRGKIRTGQALRTLMAFVLVLSFSRRIFLRFFLDARMSHFLRGHVAAFAAWNGLPRVLLDDNLKSVVLERSGAAIRFHPPFLAFAAHYHFEPRPVAVARAATRSLTLHTALLVVGAR